VAPEFQSHNKSQQPTPGLSSPCNCTHQARTQQGRKEHPRAPSSTSTDWPRKGRLFPYLFGTRVGLTFREMLGEFTLRDKHMRSISNASILHRWSQRSCWRASCKRLQKAGLESAGSTQRGEAAHNFQSFYHHLSHLFKQSDELLPSQ